MRSITSRAFLVATIHVLVRSLTVQLLGWETRPMTPKNSSEIAVERVTLVLGTLGSLILPSIYDKRAIEKLDWKVAETRFFLRSGSA